MRLNEYKQRHGFTWTQLAQQLGLSRPYVQRIALGTKTPTAQTAKQISDKTHGEVSAVEVLFPHDTNVITQEGHAKYAELNDAV